MTFSEAWIPDQDHWLAAFDVGVSVSKGEKCTLSLQNGDHSKPGAVYAALSS
jgi:hypothetical protein